MRGDEDSPVRVGIAGAGFVADIHARVYRSIGSSRVEVAAVTSRSPASAEAFAARNDIAVIARTVDELVSRDDIDVVDVCAPNFAHEELIILAAEAGKHVFCEKPLTGYFDANQVAVAGSGIREAALASADRIAASCRDNNVQLMYAENWLYMPGVERVTEFATAADCSILEMRAEESHHGSHSAAARKWSTSGGGALIMLGTHPIGAMLHLKQLEGLARSGKPIGPVSVQAQVADLSQISAAQGSQGGWLVAGWEDVENWANVIITFNDGSKGIVMASYNCMGGMRDTLEVYASNGRFACDFTRNTAFQAYAPSSETFAGLDVGEKVETTAGWSFPYIGGDLMQGYYSELEDFIVAVNTGRPARSTLELGRQVVDVIYAAYESASNDRSIIL